MSQELHPPGHFPDSLFSPQNKNPLSPLITCLTIGFIVVLVVVLNIPRVSQRMIKLKHNLPPTFYSFKNRTVIRWGLPVQWVATVSCSPRPETSGRTCLFSQRWGSMNSQLFNRRKIKDLVSLLLTIHLPEKLCPKQKSNTVSSPLFLPMGTMFPMTPFPS